jgi:hypothetical protein
MINDIYPYKLALAGISIVGGSICIAVGLNKNPTNDPGTPPPPGACATAVAGAAAANAAANAAATAATAACPAGTAGTKVEPKVEPKVESKYNIEWLKAGAILFGIGIGMVLNLVLSSALLSRLPFLKLLNTNTSKYIITLIVLIIGTTLSQFNTFIWDQNSGNINIYISSLVMTYCGLSIVFSLLLDDIFVKVLNEN